MVHKKMTHLDMGGHWKCHFRMEPRSMLVEKKNLCKLVNTFVYGTRELLIHHTLNYHQLNRPFIGYPQIQSPHEIK